MALSLALALGCTVLARPTTATATPPTLEWTEQLGTSTYDLSYGVSADGLGNVYITGRTLGSLGGPNAGFYDPFTSKYDASGTLLWTKQIGASSSDSSSSVSADGLGNVYTTGRTSGSLGGPNAGNLYMVVSKHDASGSLLWTEQMGMGLDDFNSRVSADGLGNVYISGFTFVPGGLDADNPDAFVAKYSEVPEPTTYPLALTALCLAMSRRRFT